MDNIKRVEVSTPGRVAVSPAEAALMLGMSRSKLYELLADGSLRSVKVGGRRLIPVSAITSLANEGIAA